MGIRQDLKRSKRRRDLASRVTTEVVREDGAVREVRTGPLIEPLAQGSMADVPYTNAAEAPDEVVVRRAAAGGWLPVTAAAFARELRRWREDQAGLIALWLESAHPIGTPLSVHVAAGEKLEGRFAGLAADGALRLTLDGDDERVVHAADVMLGS